MKKFTDEHIIEGLKCCIAQENCEEVSCEICPCNKFYDCKEVMLQNALDFFNRQKIEIERLEKESLSKEKAYNNEYFLRKEIEDELKDHKAEDEKLLQKLQQAKYEALMHAFSKFAGHSDYHGDTILCQLRCLAEGKETKTAKPIDTNQLKSETIKEFAERAETLVLPLLLPATLQERDRVYRCLNIIDNLVKEMTEENE